MATAVTPPPISAQRTGEPTIVEDLPRAPYRHALARLDRAMSATAVLLGCAVVVVGLVARFLAPNGLWLDEALSVNIAKLPLTQMPGALVQDGSPPLYYLFLHYWMLLFGQGEFAVRSMSAVFSVLALPLFWVAGLRAGGRRAAWAALLLCASSPWAIYYSSYARMYSMMALEAVLLYLALLRALEAPTRGRLACMAVLTAACMYTHYWNLYLLGVVAAWVLWRAVSEAARQVPAPGHAPGAARKIAWAMLGGGLLFLPWSPVFVFQVLHTGSPWSAPPSPANLLAVTGYFAGEGDWSQLLALIFFVLVGLAFFARPGATARSVVVELKVQPRTRLLGLLLLGSLVVAVVVGAVTGAAFDERYIAVVFPAFVLVCALGLTTFKSRVVTSCALTVACLAGLFSADQWGSQPRTEAVVVAAVLNEEAQPGDMVVYCPDQLGPAVDRLLNVPDVTELTFPRMLGPQRVDWVNYVSTIKSTNVQKFAYTIVQELNPGARLWFVWRNGYQGLGGSCGMLASWLGWYLPVSEAAVQANRAYYEYEDLTVYQN
ncbi:MAG TPA: glycosyltransferase family 39 protein [Acidimicrobiales bacterium]|nr:glycosyltransferase family 39 protein [Acidimicrobiales bacterium]